MENLNAEAVKKALECCIGGQDDKDCIVCPYDKHKYNCVICLMTDALALINSQEQRIKELTEKIVQLLSQVDCDKAEIKLLRKHIESLGTTIEKQEQEVYSIKADTVREFQERLIAEFRKDDRMNYYLRMTLDQIAKEMLEDTK